MIIFKTPQGGIKSYYIMSTDNTDWKIIVRFIEENEPDRFLQHLLPVGSVIRLNGDDSDWYIIKTVTIIDPPQIILFASRKSK